MKHRTVILSLALFLSLSVGSLEAQELKVTRITSGQSDLGSRMEPRKDNNGSYCALVKLSAPGITGLSFNKNDVVGDVKYSNGVYYLYVPAGNKRIRYTHTQYYSGVIDFENFDIQLDEQATYEVRLGKVSDNEKLNNAINEANAEKKRADEAESQVEELQNKNEQLQKQNEQSYKKGIEDQIRIATREKNKKKWFDDYRAPIGIMSNLSFNPFECSSVYVDAGYIWDTGFYMGGMAGGYTAPPCSLFWNHINKQDHPYGDWCNDPFEMIYTNKGVFFGASFGYVLHYDRLYCTLMTQFRSTCDVTGMEDGDEEKEWQSFSLPSVPIQLRLQYRIVGGLALSIAPEYLISLNTGETWTMVKQASPQMRHWAQGLHIDAGLHFFFYAD